MAGVITRAAAVPRAPIRLWRFLRKFVQSTPGRLIGMAAGVLVLAIIVGVLTASGVQGKGDQVRDLATTAEPLSVAAQDIYRALQDADATASSAFLAGGIEPAATRQQYLADIAQATSALTLEAGTVVAPEALQTLSSQLPIYTGLVETARANNRQGFPVGAAYLREASGLMRAKLLPAAEQLYKAENARLTAEQDAATAFPIGEVVLLLITVGLLFAAQWYLLGATNRLVNTGLVVATGAAVVALLWTSAAMTAVALHLDSARKDGSDQVAVLVQARFAAVQARADETLTLVVRGNGQSYQTDYLTAANRLGGRDGSAGLLGQARAMATDPSVRTALDNAIRSQQAWTSVHRRIREADDAGQYNQAVEDSIGTSASSSGSLFADLDKNLVSALDTARTAFNRQASAADAALTLLRPGLIVIAVVIGVASGLGIWQRLREYW
ncbi:hypothetical protein [Kutzneria sp. CA-103260]|uniref:hypothetical protein n=1 Tax=Kutzneria sp. CA-103260 TaxID=2802641 RepID=UPI001BA75A9E|nr:hypothetical protein [Kutzneria sp. CA-103260]QUQ62630.1 hypothetical protein JJ691_03420 [Kutzneria sp. CA-103260]